LLALTGTPGTGKKSVAPLLAGLVDSRLVDVNALALSEAPRRTRAERFVDVKKLRSRLLKTDLSRAVIFGHLIPDILSEGEPGFVAVLRCEPAELKRRLSARGYPGEKVLENVEAELIGVVLDSSLRAFGASAVHEYDTTGAKPASVARKIADDYLARAIGKGPWTDWTLDYDSSTKLRSLLSSARTEPAST
jgi:adenylate kinase